MVQARLLVALLALCTPLSAAVLTVGPGGTYAEIQAAIDAAQPGDTILVEPGEYGPIVVHKSLRILGDGTGSVVIETFGSNGVFVSALGPADEVVVSGIEVRANPVFSPIQASIVLSGNAGTVVLHEVRVDHALSNVGLEVQGSARAVLLGCEILDAGPIGGSSPGAAVQATGSTLWIGASTITGHVGASGFTEPGAHAVSITDGNLFVWRSTLRGGDGVSLKGFFTVPHGGDGIRAENASVVLYGGSTTDEVAGGDGASVLFGTPGDGGAGVRLLAGSQGRLQAALSITGGLTAGFVPTPGVVTDGTSTSALEPHVFATLGASTSHTSSTGGAFLLGMLGNPGAIGTAFVSLKTGPTLAIPGVEGLGILGLSPLVQIKVFALDGTGSAVFPVVVPPTPALLGEILLIQGVELFGTQLTFTDPVLVAVTS